MIKEITKKEFEERFPEVSTYGLEQHSPVYLENGVILIDTEWNGEFYNVEGLHFTPIEEPDVIEENGDVLQWKIIGYES